MTIEPSDFRAFWRAIHQPDLDPEGADGPAPFRWQQDLVDRICAEGRWPSVIDVPTGLGKTTALDIAVFTAAHARSNGLPPLPLRTYLVVDRRVIVDQAFEHARTIGDALLEPEPGSILEKVAGALTPERLERHDSAHSEETPVRPLVTGRMRGGTTWAWRWLERPDQPAIIIGTIDQVGSRMLFDGYGVGENLRPIDAALTGTDSLVLVDEAHLANAFITTVEDAARIGLGSEPLGRGPAEVVVMSATVREPSAVAPGTEPSTRSPGFVFDSVAAMDDPVAWRRLTAPKQLALADAMVRKARRVADTGAILANAARLLSREADVVGVVANTVAVARAAFDEIRTGLGTEADGRVVLITGRQREVDRAILWENWRERIEAGRDRQPEPVFVVATQAIEVGADLDFSALVTESASIDALIQRLGRLNRRGRWPSARALVVHPSDANDDDPIYGSARVATWQWLCEQIPAQRLTAKARELDFEHVIDASPGAIDRLSRSAPGTLRTEPVRVPMLFPHVLDRWVRTSPRPLDAPETGPFLHGFERDLPTASLVWRHTHKPSEVGVDAVIEGLIRSIELLPVSTQETIEIPVWAVEAWLSDEAVLAAEISDSETRSGDVPDRFGSRRRRHMIVIGPDGDPELLDGPVRPGTTVVVPTWEGGLDEFGWNPDSTAAVPDIADLVEHPIASGSSSRASRRMTLRFDIGVLSPFLRDEQRPVVTELIEQARLDIDDGQPAGEVGRGLLAALGKLLGDPEHSDHRLGVLLRRTVDGLQAVDDQIGVVVPPEQDAVTTPGLLIHGPGSIEVWSTEATHVGTSLSGTPVSLADHQAAVARRAATFADALGLTGSLRDAVIEAAAFHDVGKLDPRFQSMLNGGYGTPPEPLAKSGMDPANGRLFLRSRQLARYPRGMRHEAFSAAAVADQFRNHPEHDLITHLVASHHGRARPLMSAAHDPDPVEYDIVTTQGRTPVDSSNGIDWEQPRRFRELNERFGPWGLALLETIVRLADIGCSAEGS